MEKVKCARCQTTNSAGQEKCSRCGAPLPRVRTVGGPSDAKSRPRVPTVFKQGQQVAGRYTVRKLIGKGGMGCIYLVHDNTLREDVALKTLLPQLAKDKMVVERFYNEARIARQLSHPNIVRVHDIGMADKALYLSMEFIHGKSLRSMLDELMPGDRLPVDAALRIIDQLCAALEYAHQYTVHRDLKPENVMILADGSVKLMDFGISKLMADTKLTSTSVIMGTPNYMSPEQRKDSSNVDARTDIYSVGVMLYEILAGDLPSGMAKPASQITRDVPPMLDPIVAKCLETDPNKRYQSVQELRSALRPVLELLEAGRTPPAVRGGPAAKWLKPVRIGGIALAALVLVLAALGVYGVQLQAKPAPGPGGGPSEAPDSPVPAGALAVFQELDALDEQAAGAAEGSVSRQDLLAVAQAERQQALDAARNGRIDEAAVSAAAAKSAYEHVINWPEGMVYVPAGPASLGDGQMVDAFFADEKPVALRRYLAFDERVPGHWDGSSASQYSAAALDMPVVGVELYDALGFAAWHGMCLPTLPQWQRLAETHPDLVAPKQPPPEEDGSAESDSDAGEDEVQSAAPGPSLTEWTFTSADGSSSPGEVCKFGERFVICSAWRWQGGQVRVEKGLMGFEQAAPAVGFRCVRPAVLRP